MVHLSNPPSVTLPESAYLQKEASLSQTDAPGEELSSGEELRQKRKPGMFAELLEGIRARGDPPDIEGIGKLPAEGTELLVSINEEGDPEGLSRLIQGFLSQNGETLEVMASLAEEPAAPLAADLGLVVQNPELPLELISTEAEELPQSAPGLSKEALPVRAAPLPEPEVQVPMERLDQAEVPVPPQRAEGPSPAESRQDLAAQRFIPEKEAPAARDFLGNQRDDLPKEEARDPGRLQELRRSKGRPSIEVRDLRTAFEGGELREASPGQTALASRAPQAETEILVDLRLSQARADSSAQLGRDSSYSQRFEDALARELRGNLSNDIVRDALVVVRNGGEGSIRLNLRPASLGDVKIRLELVENKITGFIMLESSEALRAFERELPVLERAFRDSGFSETSLELFLSQDGWNPGQEREQHEDMLRFLQAQAAFRYDADSYDSAEASALIQDGRPSALIPGYTPVNLLV
ncbi:MAG: flagellar hook-length control protein FliK [Treponema sp.]|nr:flagellar hook-length control protein FliK [Treponema sp.]